MLFLREDVDLSVTVRESETLDFGDIRKHLNHGDSVFITRDPKARAELSPVEDRNREFALGTVHEETMQLAEKTDSRSKLYYISDDSQRPGSVLADVPPRNERRDSPTRLNPQSLP